MKGEGGDRKRLVVEGLKFTLFTSREWEQGLSVVFLCLFAWLVCKHVLVCTIAVLPWWGTVVFLLAVAWLGWRAAGFMVPGRKGYGVGWKVGMRWGGRVWG